MYITPPKTDEIWMSIHWTICLLYFMAYTSFFSPIQNVCFCPLSSAGNKYHRRLKTSWINPSTAVQYTADACYPPHPCMAVTRALYKCFKQYHDTWNSHRALSKWVCYSITTSSAFADRPRDALTVQYLERSLQIHQCVSTKLCLLSPAYPTRRLMKSMSRFNRCPGLVS